MNIAAAAALVVIATGCAGGPGPIPAGGEAIPLKEAKLNIEHNATDNDTGFQGSIDSEGWARLDVTGPEGVVLSFQSRGALAQLGLTPLFFRTVEPENVDVPIEESGNQTLSSGEFETLAR